MDIIHTNNALGFADDERSFHSAANIINYFGIHSCLLMSNNPNKIKSLKNCDINVVGRIPIVSEVNIMNKKYLDTKFSIGGHLSLYE